MEASYVVKVQNKGAMRRLTLARVEGGFSYEKLRSRIQDLFQLPASAQFGLSYVDKDGDVVTMAEDEDLKDALVLQALNPLRVSVEILSDDGKTSSPELPLEANLDKVTEQQTVQGELIPPTLSKSLPAESVANAERVMNSDGSVSSAAENSALPEGRGSKIDGASESKTSDGPSQASGTVADAEKVSPAEAAGENKTHEAAAEASEENCGQPIHFGIKCDGCAMVPISGPRFISRTKPNFDLCLKCYEGSGADANEYAQVVGLFRRIGHPAYVGSMCRRPQGSMCKRPPGAMCAKPAQRPNLTPASAQKNSATGAPVDTGKKTAAETLSANSTPRVLHAGVQCDECGMVPLEGPRFKSCTRFNYDLCHSCFEKSGGNASEYTRIDQPLRGYPPAMSQLLRRASPHYRLNPVSGRWVWIMNRMVPVLAVDEAQAEEKTAAAGGSDANIGGDAVNPPQPEVAASSASSATSDATAASEQEGPTKERAVDVKGESNAVENPAINTEEAQAPIDVQKVSTDNSTVNNLGETAGVEAATVPAPAAAEGDLSTQEGLLAKLAAMGFEDPKLNGELLEKNNFDLRRTLDDLCAAEEWDPILGELQEMGFYDANMNRRLMFKNNGSVKRVVKELVQMYKGEKTA